MENEKIRKIFVDNLNKYMNQKGKTQADIIADLGISSSTVSNWCTGQKIPRMGKIQMLAEYLGIKISDLIEEDSRFKQPIIAEETVDIPVIGEIAAGWDKFANEEWTGESVKLPKEYLGGRQLEDFFVLTVKGSSMYPLYMDGDKVLILKQSTVECSGDIGAVIYDDYTTLKKVEFEKGKEYIKLTPINFEFEPKVITGTDLQQFHVLGVPRVLIRDVTAKRL